MSDIFVHDPDIEPRRSDIPEIPLMSTFADIVTHFAPITIDRSRGWDVM